MWAVCKSRNPETSKLAIWTSENVCLLKPLPWRDSFRYLSYITVCCSTTCLNGGQLLMCSHDGINFRGSKAVLCLIILSFFLFLSMSCIPVIFCLNQVLLSEWTSVSLRSFLYYKKYPVSALMEYLGPKSLPIILKAEEKRESPCSLHSKFLFQWFKRRWYSVSFAAGLYVLLSVMFQSFLGLGVYIWHFQWCDCS